jgi:serine/threonine protein kinase
METILAGHYQIIRALGGGGFGQMFLAKDIHLPDNPLCVVKQLQLQDFSQDSRLINLLADRHHEAKQAEQQIT